MKFSLPILLLTALSGIYAATPVPKGSSIATIDLPNSADLRIYHQDTSLTGIKEISTKLPPTGVLNDGYIFGGPTRSNTPLAALTWDSGNGPEVR